MAELRLHIVHLTDQVEEEIAERAQLAIVTEATWHLIAPAPYRIHGFHKDTPMPAVACLVVDISKVPEDLSWQLGEAIKNHTQPQLGVVHPIRLVKTLLSMGATLRLPELQPEG